MKLKCTLEENISKSFYLRLSKCDIIPKAKLEYQVAYSELETQGDSLGLINII